MVKLMDKEWGIPHLWSNSALEDLSLGLSLSLHGVCYGSHCKALKDATHTLSLYSLIC